MSRRTPLLIATLLAAGLLLWLLAPRRADRVGPATTTPAAVSIPTLGNEASGLPALPAKIDEAFVAKLQDILTRKGTRPHEAILAFKDEDALRRFLARASTTGADVLGRLDALGYVRVRIRDYETFARELAAHADDYARVTSNLVLSPPTPPTSEVRTTGPAAPVGGDLLKLLGLDAANNSRGAGVTIAILDGGAAPGPAFGTRLTYLDVGYGVTGYGDDAAHATAVAALAGGASADVPGVAPAARLLSIKVTGADGLADSFSVAAGVMAAIEAGAKVINISLGSYGDSPVLAAAIEQAVAAGIAVVASSGNDQANRIAWPAAYAGVVSVGATDAQGRQAVFSNSGDGLQLTAPGYAIATVGVGDTRVSFSGTSASAPVVSGAIAALLSTDPSLTPLAAADLLATYGNDGGVAGADADYGRATINPGWALDRDNTDRVDPAICSLSHDAAGGAISIVVQNRSNRPLLGLMLNLVIGGIGSDLPLPALDPAASTTVTSRIPASASPRDDGRLLVIATLVLPTGVADLDATNNRFATLLTMP